MAEDDGHVECGTLEEPGTPSAGEDQNAESMGDPNVESFTDHKKRKANKKGRNTRIASIRISEEQLQEAFLTYCSLPNYSFVARRCGMYMNTVRKYAALQNWEARRAKLVAQAREEEDYPVVKATQESIRMIRTLKRKIESAIDGIDAADFPIQQIAADLEKMVKLEQILMGNVDERREVVHTTHEERIRKLREARGILTKPAPELPEHALEAAPTDTPN